MTENDVSKMEKLRSALSFMEANFESACERFGEPEFDQDPRSLEEYLRDEKVADIRNWHSVPAVMANVCQVLENAEPMQISMDEIKKCFRHHMKEWECSGFDAKYRCRKYDNAGIEIAMKKGFRKFADDLAEFIGNPENDESKLSLAIDAMMRRKWRWK